MEAEITKIRVDGLLQIAKWISYLIVFGGGLSISVILKSISVATNSKEDIKIGGIQIPMRHFPQVAFSFTVGHGFLAWIFIQRVPDIIKSGKENAELAWAKLTASDALVFYNMQPRLKKQIRGFQKKFTSRPQVIRHSISLYLSVFVYS